MKYKNFFHLIVIALCIMSCAPSTPKEFNNESKRIQTELLEQFRMVETLDDLIKRGPKIRSLSYELVELIQRADSYYKKTHEEMMPLELPISEVLKAEMKRIYQFDGGRETVEKYQREALFLLDEYAKS